MRARALLVAIAAATALAAPSAAAADPADTGYPDSMAATGDSITRAFNTGPLPFLDAPWNSWSTGWSSAVWSHYRRILAANWRIFARNFNDARSGAEMADLVRQVQLVNLQRVEYVTVLMGANDACASGEAGMTPVEEFRAQFEAAMAALSAGSPSARIFVASIPDVYRLWLILKDDPAARATWGLLRICQSLLARPASTEPADDARRRRVRQRVVAYNEQLAAVCARYVHCRFDGNAVFDYQFQRVHVSTRDYFHPSLEGQRTLADVTWRAGFDFGDSAAPVTTATAAPAEGGTRAALSAVDDAGVAGIEYRLGESAYRRYEEPVLVPDGAAITYRAADVNGNVEAAHTLAG